ncbi:ABC transporter permease [Paenactinomyces guangxiensis]|uniref:ABC-2 family transporter protein n=1 Tax=Paenactinomyces guangxiensis TaxID=1490290 RepID=A0A7W1WSP4_9BACL|nr:ABC-2 family transporter protein [Paenactinomyces guangxiensis]MBA4495322.1 ABC-2 family transporter protein [Paenactinomyces guangxiensis]MBH8592556.1 ABC-2 family transporter protein [Paenactinomyces guangxiensis]
MKMYWTLLTASIRSRMQYKINFLLSAAANGLIMVIDFVLLAAILLRFDNILGWSIYEIGVLYGISSVSISAYRLIAPEIHNFDKYMIDGEFDSLLIRPVSPLTLLISKNLDFSRLGGMVQGGLILLISFSRLSLSPPDLLLLVLYTPIALLSGFLISFALGLMTATIAFWTQRVKDFQSFTLYAPFNAANYPISIYPGWLKIIFFTVLPVGFMNYLPATFLLHKGGDLWDLVISPVFAVLFVVLSLKFWRFGIQFYHSTGS